jgi:hypothetical protein
MKKSEIEKQELIDRYLENNLKGAALSEFEAKLLTDADFATEVAIQKIANEVVVAAGFAQIKNNIAQANAQYQQRQNSQSFWKWASFSAILLVGGLGGLYIFLQTPEKLTNTTNTINTTDSTQVQAIKNETVKITEKTIITEKNTTPKQTTTQVPEKINVAEKNTQPTSSLNSQQQPIIVSPITESPEIEPVVSKVPAPSITIPSLATHELEKIALRKTPIPIQEDKKDRLIEENKKNTAQENTAQENTAQKDTETALFVPTQENFVIQPRLNIFLELPIQSLAEGQLTIYDKNGIIIYQQSLRQGASFTWDGRKQNGEDLPLGVYSYKIEYTNSVKIGTITILQ